MSRYAPLLTVSTSHEFYGQDKSPISISVTQESQRILASANCLLKTTRGGIVVIAEENAQSPVDGARFDLTLFRELAESQPDLCIEFQLHNTEPDYYNYTPSIIDSVIAQFERALGTDEDAKINFVPPGVSFTKHPDETVPVRAIRIWDQQVASHLFESGGVIPELAEVGAHTLSLLDRQYATPVFRFSASGNDTASVKPQIEYWRTLGQADKRPLCVFYMPLAELLKQVQEADSPEGVSIRANFSSRKVYWRYNLISFSERNTTGLEVVDRTGEVKFTRLKESGSVVPESVRFISDQAIALSARSNRQFALKGRRSSNGRNIDLFRPLPQASPTNLSVVSNINKEIGVAGHTVKSETTFVSDIYIN